MKEFFATIKNIWKIEELRNKILITLGFLIVYRLGSQIPLPGIDASKLDFNVGNAGALVSIINIFTGGAFSQASILALGIMPYISASIVIQLMGLAIPYLQKLQKEGESGRKRINDITRWLTIGICLLQAPGYITLLKTQFLPVSSGAYMVDGFLFTIPAILVLITGCVFSMWLGEKITERGIGNGISLLIMIGIIASLPGAIVQEIGFGSQDAGLGPIFVLIEMVLWLAVIAFSIWLVKAVRKVPVQYAKRMQGGSTSYFRSVQKAARSYIPLKVSATGVMPIIFAQAIMTLPIYFLTTYANDQESFIGKFAAEFSNIFGFYYNFAFAILIIVFTFFYTAITIQTNQMADDLKRSQGFIPGVKPGVETENFLDLVLSRITLPGAVLLAFIAILPSIAKIAGVGDGFAIFFGGTSLLIMVGVVLDTLQQINAYLLNHHYDGLMESGRSGNNL